VLAIDDDPLALELTDAILSPHGFSVLRASGGKEGLAIARRELPSLIILDLLMPEMDGFAVVEHLESDPSTASIPIVVLTGTSLSAEEKRRLNRKVAHLARKTEFDRADFTELVQRICENAGGSDGR
jgi:CheY-like chemotaxis protein